MDTSLIIILAAVALAAVWALTHVIVTLRWKQRTARTLAEKEAVEKLAASEKAALERMLAEKENDVKDRIEDLRRQQNETMTQQMAAMRAQMTAESEKVLKAREEELSKKAKETFENISGGLSKDLNAMKEAFEANKKTQSEDNAAMKQRFETAVKSLEEQSRNIGGKADHLAEALRGQKKMQGCWGETVLANLLTTEGLVEGRDFEKESTLRDELGFIILNEDSEKRMRPDYILHLPDNNDIVIDAKVSLAAYSDYVEAQSEAEKAEAARRNAEAVREQIKKLAKKEYEKYLRPDHRMLDYVLMFVPNYPALQLAYSIEPALWRNAYAQGVLITSEETLMPFLRMISIAWTNVEQVKNQQQIIASAQMMIDRVADFAKAHAEMGQKLEAARECYDKCSDKLKESGHSIVQSARQVVKLGVPANPKKPLPEEMPDHSPA